MATAIARRVQRPNAKSGAETMTEIESAAAMQGPSAGEKRGTANGESAMRIAREVRIGRVIQIAGDARSDRAGRTGRAM